MNRCASMVGQQTSFSADTLRLTESSTYFISKFQMYSPVFAAIALIQAAFHKAAWTNVMLAEIVSFVRFAGFTSTGACSMGNLFPWQLSSSRAAARKESARGYVGFVQ